MLLTNSIKLGRRINHHEDLLNIKLMVMLWILGSWLVIIWIIGIQLIALAIGKQHQREILLRNIITTKIHHQSIILMHLKEILICINLKLYQIQQTIRQLKVLEAHIVKGIVNYAQLCLKSKQV